MIFFLSKGKKKKKTNTKKKVMKVSFVFAGPLRMNGCMVFFFSTDQKSWRGMKRRRFPCAMGIPEG